MSEWFKRKKTILFVTARQMCVLACNREGESGGNVLVKKRSLRRTLPEVRNSPVGCEFEFAEALVPSFQAPLTEKQLSFLVAPKASERLSRNHMHATGRREVPRVLAFFGATQTNRKNYLFVFCA